MNLSYQAQQLSFAFTDTAEPADDFAEVERDNRGAIFTRKEVVEFILDLTGYTVDQPLHTFRLLEPSFGEGDFLIPVVNRLLESSRSHVVNDSQVVDDLTGAIRAVEVHRKSVESTRGKLKIILAEHGISESDAQRLLEAWIIVGDFLLADIPQSFTHTVGNPPYVRQELIPNELMAEYRARYRTIYDRADLYVPFIERCLSSLATGGTMGFICSDRWMKNKYGGPLRAKVAKGYHLTYYVDMVDTPAFQSEVIAYPAITIIRREKSGPTRIARRPRIQSEKLMELARVMHSDSLEAGKEVVEINDVARSQDPWILQSFDQLAIVRRLEAEYPVIESAGCMVGIGVATGADSVYIGPFETMDVETDRKLPLIKTGDIESGTIHWHGCGVINPFRDDGAPVELAKYPKLARYLKQHEEVIRKRNCAKKNPNNWYRTIDRIYPELTYTPKLLIPDIKGDAHVVYDEGHFYPHHNLYYITSAEWDLKALQAVLRSGIAKLFVSIYSTKMRGDFLRFQAQYLRRIRIPKWKDIPAQVQKFLMQAASSGNTEECNRAIFDLYRFSSEERAALGGNGS